MGLLLASAILWASPLVALLVYMVVASLATMEYFACVRAAGLPAQPYVGLAGVLLLIVSGWVQATTAWGATLPVESLAVYIVLTVVFVRQFMLPLNKDAIVSMGVTLLGLLYIGVLFSFMVKIFIGWGEPARYLMFYFFAVVKVSDIGAFFTGSAIGRHKLIPKLSPGKTWEGFMGGVIASLVVSLFMWWKVGGDFGVISFGWVHALVLGLAMPTIGIIGDLAESQIKRASGVKDSSKLIRGMGGVLDVVDSPLLAAPFFYVYLCWASVGC